MTTCMGMAVHLLSLVHRRRKVLAGGGRGKVQIIFFGGGGKGGGGEAANFSLAVTCSEPPPQSVPNNYISHIEN